MVMHQQQATTATNATNVTGNVAIANGGTGATTAAGARTNLGLGSLSTLSTITSSEITDGTIAADDLSSNAVTTVKIADTAVTEAKLADNSVTLSKLADSTCAADEVLKRGSSTWECIAESLINQKPSENRLVYVNDHSVNYTEVTGRTMTVRMNDGNYYTSASPLTFSFTNSNGDLSLDTGSESVGNNTWYYLYAIPAAAANTFTITASLRSPVDGTPGPLGNSTYKYIGAFLNHSGNYIVEFRQVSSNKFILGWEFWEIQVDGTQAITDHTLQFTPKSAQAFIANVSITNIDSTGGGGCRFILSQTASGFSACDIVAYPLTHSNTGCEMNVDPSTPEKFIMKL